MVNNACQQTTTEHQIFSSESPMSLYSQARDNINQSDLFVSVLQFAGIKTSLQSFPDDNDFILYSQFFKCTEDDTISVGCPKYYACI